MIWQRKQSNELLLVKGKTVIQIIATLFVALILAVVVVAVVVSVAIY